MTNVKIIVIGDPRVGKTSIINRIVDDSFDIDSKSTVGVDMCVVTIEGIKFTLWDTAGQEEYNLVTSNFYRNADGVLLIHDISKPQTSINIRNWILRVHAYCNHNIPILIVSNKNDLEGKRSSVKIDGLLLEHATTSALTGHGIDKIKKFLLSIKKHDETLEQDTLVFNHINLKEKTNKQEKKKESCGC